MSRFSGLLAGRTGQPASRGGGLGRRELAGLAAREDAGARTIAIAAQSARPFAVDVKRGTGRARRKLGLTRDTLRE